MKKHSLTSPIAIFSMAFFPIAAGILYAVYRSDPTVYFDLVTEDRFVEWSTFFGQALAAIAAFVTAVLNIRNPKAPRLFFFALTAFCVFVALEEISYGQRVFNFPSPHLVEGINSQREFNLHNVPSFLLHIRMKYASAIVFSLYGVVLPLLNLIPAVRAFFARIKVVIPPVFLAVGFGLGALADLDYPTGMEEEIAEMFYALCLALFTGGELVFWLKKSEETERAFRSTWSFVLPVALVLLAFSGGLWGESYFIFRHTVTPLEASDIGNLYSVPAPSGELPCGLFDVGVHDFRVIRLSQYPQCTAAALDVYCLTSTGEWTQNDVHNVRRSRNDRSLLFDSTQTGTCGVFPR
jgi:hypothetical protein